MKTKTIKTLGYAFVMGIFITGCSTPAERVEDEEGMTDDDDATETSYRDDIENYRLESSEELSDYEERINEMKETNDYRNAVNNYNTRVDELERQNRELREKLDDYEDDGESGWQRFKTEFSHDMKELGNSIKNIGVNNVK